jgi:Mg2+ and Co2+ transporter CorA
MTLEERAIEYRANFGNDEDAIMLAMTGFAEMIAAEERERCAKVADKAVAMLRSVAFMNAHYRTSMDSCAEVAKAIRNLRADQ